MAAKIKWERRKIKLACTGKPVEIEADVYGPLAVHDALGAWKRYAITHIGTGMNMSIAAGTFSSKKKARDACKKIAALADWNIIGPKLDPRLKGKEAMPPAEREAIASKVRAVAKSVVSP